MLPTQRGFTLIELIVSIIIIGILAAIAIPMYNRAMENAREKEAKITLEAIWVAEDMFYIDKKVYATDFNSLSSYMPNNPNATSDYYDYAITGTTAVFSATATRKNDSSKVFTIDSNGKITP